jgi:hypothetical protein
MPLTNYISKMSLVNISRPYPDAPGYLFEWRHPVFGSAYVAYRGLPHPPSVWMKALADGVAPVLPQNILWRGQYFAYMSESEDYQMPAVALRAAVQLTDEYLAANALPDQPDLPVLTGPELAEKLGIYELTEK